MNSPEARGRCTTPFFRNYSVIRSASGLMSPPAMLSTVAAVALAVALAGAAVAQGSGEGNGQGMGAPPAARQDTQQQSQPAAPPPDAGKPAVSDGGSTAPGAVPQHGGSVAQKDRAPDLTLDDRQREAVRKAVLARHTAQKPLPGFEPEAGATAPRALKLESMPPEIIQDIPELRHFFVADIANRQVLVVNAMDRKIVAVIVVPGDAANAAPAAASGFAETAKDVKESTREQAVGDAARDANKDAADGSKTAGNDAKGGGSRAHIDRNKHYDDDTNDPHVEKSVDQAKQADSAVLRNGVLTAPDAPKNSETAPAKFSEINAALDGHPTMSGGADLTAEQAAEVYRTVMADKSLQAVDIKATAPAAQLPNLTPAQPFPDALLKKFPALATYGYIKTADKVLIVTPANKILVGWIDAKGQDPSSKPAEAAAAARGG